MEKSGDSCDGSAGAGGLMLAANGKRCHIAKIIVIGRLFFHD